MPDLVDQQPDRGQRGGDREQQVHVQAPAPVERLGQHAAEQQPDRRAAAGDGAVDAERLAALVGIGEGGRQQRQCRGGEQRAEDALGRAGGDQHPEGARGAAHRGRGGEAEQAADERPLAAEQVAEAAAEQQQRPERQRVGGHDPLPRVIGEAEVALRRRQRDVHDRRVEHDHELGDGDHAEDQPASLVMRSLCGCHRGSPFGRLCPGDDAEPRCDIGARMSRSGRVSRQLVMDTTTIAITGATGVVGRRAVRELLARGPPRHRRRRARARGRRLARAARRATPSKPTSSTRPPSTSAFAGADAVVNLLTHIPSADRMATPGAWDENDRLRREASAAIAGAAEAAGASRLVQESLAFVYADGGDAWLDEDAPVAAGAATATALAAEANAAALFDGDTVVLRFGLFVGPDSDLTPRGRRERARRHLAEPRPARRVPADRLAR